MHNFCDFFSHYGEKRGNGDAPHWAFGGRHGLCLALQREVVTLAGRSLEPQEVPLRGFAGVAPELVLAWAGVLIITLCVLLLNILARVIFAKKKHG